MRTNRDMSCCIAVILLAGVVGVADRAVHAHCAQDRAAQHWAAASLSCRAELDRTGHPARAIDAATAAFYQQQWHETLQLATRALATRWVADAHYLIGAAQLRLEQHATSASHLAVAATLHARMGDARAVARDLHQLSGVWFQLGYYAQALRAEESSRDAALRAGDRRMMVYTDIARADIFRLIGDLFRAEVAIHDALDGVHEPMDRVTALLKRGILHNEQGMPEIAREPLVRALEEERRAPQPRQDTLASLHLNLAYVERRAGDVPRALEQVELARQAGAVAMQWRLNRGLVLADSGRLEEAAADFTAAEAEKRDGEWAWWVPFQVARVAARRGRLAEAIDADRRAIDEVAALATRSGALGPTLVASRREPHLHLIGLYASAGRWQDALDVVAALDGQSLLVSNERAFDPAPSPEDRALPRSRRSPPAVASDAAARAVQAWRGQRLNIVVPGGKHVWRLDVHDGAVTGSNVGDAGALADWARTLESDPLDREAGHALGAAMLGPELPAGTPITLLVIGPIARAPLAGLRVGQDRAIHRYPLARARGFLPRPATTRATLPPVVIGDPDGGLPAARQEAQDVAARFQVHPLVGAAATHAAFQRTAGARLLHIATHTGQGLDGAVLHLADGEITPAEIENLKPAPGLVVLASCGGAAGRDDAGNGSLAAAFLDAGAETVIGTRWSVDDGEAAQLIRAFYANGGAHDAVRALGAAQRDSKLEPTTWAAFEAFVARPTL